MATLTNYTDHVISIVGVRREGNDIVEAYRHEVAAHRLPDDGTPPGPPPTITIPDEHARDWAGRTQWVGLGKVKVDYARGNREANGGTDDLRLEAKPHWRTAIKEANATDDLDRLEDMLAAEDRPAVREAIETRMRELIG